VVNWCSCDTITTQYYTNYPLRRVW
jgi:hypothetical protein